MGAGRRHVGPDALAPRQGLQAPPARGAARVLGPGRRRRAEHAAPARASSSPSDATRSSSAPGPNGLAAAIRLAEAGRSVSCSRPPTAPGGAVRTEELTLPGFHHDTFSSVYPAAAASPVFARMPLERTGSSGCTRRPAPRTRCPAARRRALPRRRGDGREPRRRHPATATLGRVRPPFLEHCEAVRATMLSGFPPVGGPLQMLTGAGPLRLLDFARLLPASRGQPRQAAVRRTAARAPGCTARRCTATRRRTAPARRSPPST